MAIQGLRDTSNFVDGERPQNWRAGILMLYPNGMAPLTALTAAMSSESTDDPQFNWWEKALFTDRLLMAEDLDTSETEIDLTVSATQQGSFVTKAGDIWMVEKTGEMLFVTVDPAVNTKLVVARAQFGSSAAGVTVATENPYIVKVGSAYEEGSAAPTGVAFDPNKQYNYTQIFRDTIEATRTAQKTRLRTKPQKAEAKRECAELHSVALEKAFWWGRKSESTRNGRPWRTTAGIDSFIPSGNKQAVSNGELTMDLLEQYMYDIFRFGSSEKMAFAGNRALLALNQAVRKNSQYNFDGSAKEYGMAVTRFTCPFGTLVIKTHPLFTDMAGPTGASPAYYAMDSTMYVLDMKNIKYRNFTGDDMRYETKLEIPGMDGYKEGYISDCGLEVHHAKTHHKITQMYKGKADS